MYKIIFYCLFLSFACSAADAQFCFEHNKNQVLSKQEIIRYVKKFAEDQASEVKLTWPQMPQGLANIIKNFLLPENYEDLDLEALPPSITLFKHPTEKKQNTFLYCLSSLFIIDIDFLPKDWKIIYFLTAGYENICLEQTRLLD